MKNEHIIWAYAEREDGSGQVLILGVTDEGMDYLRAGVGKDKKTLVITPPGKGFTNVTQVLMFHEKDKATLKQRFYEANVIVSEVH